MASTSVSVTIRVADIEAVRLFVWELRQLIDEMRVVADPYAERLEHACDRFAQGDDEHLSEVDDG